MGFTEDSCVPRETFFFFLGISGISREYKAEGRGKGGGGDVLLGNLYDINLMSVIVPVSWR